MTFPMQVRLMTRHEHNVCKDKLSRAVGLRWLVYTSPGGKLLQTLIFTTPFALCCGEAGIDQV